MVFSQKKRVSYDEHPQVGWWRKLLLRYLDCDMVCLSQQQGLHLPRGIRSRYRPRKLLILLRGSQSPRAALPSEFGATIVVCRRETARSGPPP